LIKLAQLPTEYAGRLGAGVGLGFLSPPGLGGCLPIGACAIWYMCDPFR